MYGEWDTINSFLRTTRGFGKKQTNLYVIEKFGVKRLDILWDDPRGMCAYVPY